MTRSKQSKYINRELSWLEFNQRVLEEARDESVPVLERLKFLAITASNLDEFFMVRVGGLQALARQASAPPDPTGMTAQQQLRAIDERTRQLTLDQQTCLREQLEPAMAAAGIWRLAPEQLSDRQRQHVLQHFQNELAAVLTPMAASLDEEHEPLLVNRALHVAARLAPAPGMEGSRFALIPFLGPVRRFVSVPADQGYAYVLLEAVIRICIERFFPGEQVLETTTFRITRSAEMSVREDSASDLLSTMEEVLDARKQSDCVRLELSEDASPELRRFLQQLLAVADEQTALIPGPLDLAAFMELSELRGFDQLKYEAWQPQLPPRIDPTQTMFETLARQDLLLVHPYDSFEPVVRLIEEAASDRDVLAIKQTLYRTGRKSAIVAALQRAAEVGKNVTVLVELKARFDEARNIGWARELEHSGVQVIYGVKGLKTHAKLCIVVRRESHGIQRYVHFGTGNYNETTARVYSDVSYLTSDSVLGNDATNFFNAITGYSQPLQFQKIGAAPIGLREKLLEMIEVETQRKQQGQRAHIVVKLNSLVDSQIIDALYAASQAGVQVKLNVRGVCCLRPGVPGLSENITVISIVDRFLEHARIFYFYHGGDERVFISSADWMPRNLDRRVELLVPIQDAVSRRRLIAVLDTYFRDNVKARELQSDGSYVPIKSARRRKRVRSQETIFQESLHAVREAANSRPTMFEPHRAATSEP